MCLALQVNTKNKELQEKLAALDTEVEELRRIRKMLESKLYEPGTWVNSQLSLSCM